MKNCKPNFWTISFSLMQKESVFSSASLNVLPSFLILRWVDIFMSIPVVSLQNESCHSHGCFLSRSQESKWKNPQGRLSPLNEDLMERVQSTICPLATMNKWPSLENSPLNLLANASLLHLTWQRILGDYQLV